MHYTHNLSIVFESDDRARGRSSFDAVGDIGGEAFVAAGYYEDEYVRTERGGSSSCTARFRSSSSR